MGVRIEIHWKTFAPESLYPFGYSEMLKNAQSMRVGDTTLNLMSDDHLLLYLCVHGAKHMWFRLGWLYDIHIYLKNRKGHIDWNEQISVAKRNGIHRPLVQAVVMSHLLMDSDLPKEVELLYRSDRTIKKLVRNGMKAIGMEENRYNGMDAKNLIYMTLNLMGLKVGLRYKWDCISRLFISPQDWNILRLPTNLFMLYYFLRPFLFVIRRLKRLYQ